MEIRELSTLFKMSITVTNGESRMTFPSVIVAVEGNRLYVEPFTYHDAILSFDSSNIAISMIAYQDEKSPYLWQSVKVEKDTLDGKTCHVITSGLSGVKINRRDNFRVFIGLPGTVKINGSEEKHEVIVRDISETGFAVMIDINTKVKINSNDALRVEFYDAVQEQTIVLLGRIVRGAVLEKYYLFGCRTLQDGGMSKKYISNKQLEKRINSVKKQ